MSLQLQILHQTLMCSFQFAQFALMTQTVAVYGTYVLQYIGSHKMKVILCGQGVSQNANYIALPVATFNCCAGTIRAGNSEYHTRHCLLFLCWVEINRN